MDEFGDEPLFASPDSMAVKVKSYALGLLNRRDYPRQELISKIQSKFQSDARFSIASAESTVQWLEELGYVNDRKYCEYFVSASIAKGRGRLRVQQELRQKRLEQSLIDEVLDNVSDDWLETAVSALQRKFKVPPATPSEKAKVIRFLQYRGFLPEEIYSALDVFTSSFVDR